MSQVAEGRSVKERPIIFSGPMVTAILAGQKTQTRRVIKGQALEWLAPDMFMPEFVADPENGLCPYGQPGDRLWVRETWTALGNEDGHPINEAGELVELREAALRYRADTVPAPYGLARLPDGSDYDGPWRSPIHMPRWASRLTLEVVSVRVERLQAITEEDARAEGVERHDDDGVTYYGPYGKGHASAIHEFMRLWDSINAERGHGWESNPWVWGVEFRKVEA